MDKETAVHGNAEGEKILIAETVSSLGLEGAQLDLPYILSRYADAEKYRLARFADVRRGRSVFLVPVPRDGPADGERIRTAAILRISRSHSGRGWQVQGCRSGAGIPLSGDTQVSVILDTYPPAHLFLKKECLAYLFLVRRRTRRVFGVLPTEESPECE